MAKPRKADKASKEKSSATQTPDGMDILRRIRESALARFGEKVMASSDFDCGLNFLNVPDLAYQWAMGRPGYAMGRIQSLMGFEGSSKTSKQLWLANLAFEQGGFAAAVYVEHADSAYHMRQYVREQRFADAFMCYPCDTLEEAIDTTYQINDEFIKNDPGRKLPKVLIFDSVAGATQQKLLDDDNEPGKPKPGGIGGIMADFVNAMKVKVADPIAHKVERLQDVIRALPHQVVTLWTSSSSEREGKMRLHDRLEEMRRGLEQGLAHHKEELESIGSAWKK